MTIEIALQVDTLTSLVKPKDIISVESSSSSPSSSSSTPCSPSPSSTDSSSSSASSTTKRLKMGNNLDYLNDLGIPMDGVELDSSTDLTSTLNERNIIDPSLMNHLNSNTNSNSATSSSIEASAINPQTLISANNEAIASNSPTLSLCEESKCSGSYSPDYGAPRPWNTDEGFHNSQSSTDRGGSHSSHQQANSVRRFGDLFDDDDLD